MTIPFILAAIIAIAFSLFIGFKLNKAIDGFRDNQNDYVHLYQTKFDAKLIKLGVKHQYDVNVFLQKGEIFENVRICTTFRSFIIQSFNWSQTPEGREFWYEISKK